jgi:hypothetical protein
MFKYMVCPWQRHAARREDGRKIALKSGDESARGGFIHFGRNGKNAKPIFETGKVS